MTSSADITALLVEWSNGDRSALDRLIPLVERELRRMARSYVYKFRPGDSMQPTVLVHEAYLRLIDQTRVQWQNRAHFFAIAATMMQRVLKNYARRARQQKRGGGKRHYSPTEVPLMNQEKSEEILSLEEGLETLAKLDKRKHDVVVLRYYGGLSFLEVAHVLEVSEATVHRDWRFARTWLYKEYFDGE